jgi:chromosome segregation ATPase
MLLSSTPLEMEDDFLFSASMNMDTPTATKTPSGTDRINSQSVHYDENRNGGETTEDNKSIDTVNSEAATANASNIIQQHASQLEVLREQLSVKTRQNEELSACLLKQTNFCENLSELLRTSDEKSKDLETRLTEQTKSMTSLEDRNGKLLIQISFSQLKLLMI